MRVALVSALLVVSVLQAQTPSPPVTAPFLGGTATVGCPTTIPAPFTAVTAGMLDGTIVSAPTLYADRDVKLTIRVNTNGSVSFTKGQKLQLVSPVPPLLAPVSVSAPSLPTDFRLFLVREVRRQEDPTVTTVWRWDEDLKLCWVQTLDDAGPSIPAKVPAAECGR